MNLWHITMEEIASVIAAREQAAAEEPVLLVEEPEIIESEIEAPKAEEPRAEQPEANPPASVPEEAPPQRSTARGMYAWAQYHWYAFGQKEAKAVKHFEVIAGSLAPDEEVLVTFMGPLCSPNTYREGDTFAFAMTDKRFLIGRKKVFTGEEIYTIYVDQVTNITLDAGIITGMMGVETLNKTFHVRLGKASAQKLTSQVMRTLDAIKRAQSIP